MSSLSPVVFDFLKQLQENNNREWYHQHKQMYREAKAAVESFLDYLIPELVTLEPALRGLTPQTTMFRIFRDIRFSKDKTPYKTNFGAVIAPGGRKSPYSGLYLHVEPGKCMAGGGIYKPQKEVLDAVRQELYYNGESFRKIIDEPQFRNWFGEINSMGDKLKRMPKGYEANSHNADLLKLKTITVMYPLKDEVLLSDKAAEEIIETYKILKPFNHFLNEAIDMGKESN
ncbi:MAG: DUF2461 domain-containing protein [Bacteroidales bacterium]